MNILYFTINSYTLFVISHEEVPNALSLIHTAISNVKRQFLGVYYKMESEYLQYFLNQLCS